jgi:hypothetical protein
MTVTFLLCFDPLDFVDAAVGINHKIMIHRLLISISSTVITCLGTVIILKVVNLDFKVQTSEECRDDVMRRKKNDNKC